MTRRTSVNATGSKLMAEFCFFSADCFDVGRGRIHSYIHSLEKVKMYHVCIVRLLIRTLSGLSIIFCLLCRFVCTVYHVCDTG